MDKRFLQKLGGTFALHLAMVCSSHQPLKAMDREDPELQAQTVALTTSKLLTPEEKPHELENARARHKAPAAQVDAEAQRRQALADKEAGLRVQLLEAQIAALQRGQGFISSSQANESLSLRSIDERLGFIDATLKAIDQKTDVSIALQLPPLLPDDTVDLETGQVQEAGQTAPTTVLKAAFFPEMERVEPETHPIKPAIPESALGYEDIYERFLNGKLVYHPMEGSDVGKIEIPIAALINPLESTFDLSSCGNAGQHLSISTGYRKGIKVENANKLEIWFSPRFLIEKELQSTAGHFSPIMSSWNAKRVPFALFFTWGGWDKLGCFEYSCATVPEQLSAADLHSIWSKALVTGRPPYPPSSVAAAYAKNFKLVF